MHAAHPSSMMVVDDNMMRSFPIVQVEVKIRVPDQFIGRLIGKNGVCLKKIMDETATHISINEARSQHEVQQYQSPELFDRIITIRGNTWNTVMVAEKNVQQKLRQFLDQDMSATVAGQPPPPQQQQQQYYHAPGVIMSPVDNIGPYIAPPGSVPPPPNTYQTAAYNAIPMGVSPQSFYIQNPAAVPNFSIPTGQYGGHSVSSVPPSMQNCSIQKSRVYVPNQIVGILIGTRGQTIKSVIAESGAIISIEGDHPKKNVAVRKDIQGENKDEGAEAAAVGGSPANDQPANQQQQQEMPKQEHQPADGTNNDGIDLKSIAETEPIADKNGDGGEREEVVMVAVKVEPVDEQESADVCHKSSSEGGKVEQQKVNGSQHNSVSAETAQGQQETTMVTTMATSCHQFNGSANKRNNGNNMVGNQQHQGNHHDQRGMPDQRGVFIQGYDYQVSKALYWVFQKVADSQNMRPEEIILTCESIVPCKVIGRIIGKQGQNVKQLQLRSGAHIKVPDDINQHDKNCVEAAVKVVGNFCAVQMVQQHFGTLIMDAEWRDSREYDEKRTRYREGSR